MWHSKQRIKGDNILDCHINTPCTNCGKLIRKCKTGLCVDCYNQTLRVNSKYCKVCNKRIRFTNHTGLCRKHYDINRHEKIVPNKKKYPHSKRIVCKNCGKQIRTAGLCSTCLYLANAKIQIETNKKHAAKLIKTQTDKSGRNYNPSPCLKSPSGYHRWFINGENVGTCFYCDHSEKMPELKQQIRRTYVDVAN